MEEQKKKKKRKHLFDLRYPNHDPVYLDEFGAQLKIGGIVLIGQGGLGLQLMMPDNGLIGELKEVNPNVDEWIQIFKQLDDPANFELEPNGKYAKAIHRKCTRQIGGAVKWEVFRRDNFKCRFCFKDFGSMTIDHWMPVELGGTDEVGNLRTCCPKCNRRKGSMHPDKWIEIMKQKKIGEYANQS